jgi:hypothetical protein
MTPDYEVKLLLDPSVVLDTDRNILSSVMTTFNIASAAIGMNIQFLDTDNREIYNSGWSARIRKLESSEKIELNYKKRYTVTDANIDDALTTANEDGFDAGETKWDAQVDWGYEKLTLSISRDKKTLGGGLSGLSLPDVEVAREILVKEVPNKFDNCRAEGWGTAALSRSRVFGPVLAKRFVGAWGDISKLYIEIWPIFISSKGVTEHIVEVSFKEDDQKTASVRRNDLISLLRERGWLLPRDSLRTQLIMDNY